MLIKCKILWTVAVQIFWNWNFLCSLLCLNCIVMNIVLLLKTLDFAVTVLTFSATLNWFYLTLIACFHNEQKWVYGKWSIECVVFTFVILFAFLDKIPSIQLISHVIVTKILYRHHKPFHVCISWQFFGYIRCRKLK